MKHLQPVNEFWDSFKKAFSNPLPDDDIAQEILAFVGPTVEVKAKGNSLESPGAVTKPTKFVFQMKNSEISVEKGRLRQGGYKIYLKIDSAELHCKQDLKDKLWDSLFQTWDKSHGPSAIKNKFRSSK